MAVAESSRCLFCGTPLFGRFLLTVRPPRGQKRAAVYPLCTEHAGVLKDAGSEGRVYGPTGARWWLGERTRRP